MRRFERQALPAFGMLVVLSSPTVAASQLEKSVVFIETGYVENGNFVKIEEGTGFLVHSAGWVITAKHVVDAPLPSGKLRRTRGSIGSRTANNYQLFDTPAPVTSADVALLRFSPNLQMEWPHLKIKLNHPFKNLDKITAYGFPNGNDIEARPGVVSSLLGPKGAIGVNVGLAPGMSGGPVVLDGSRCVVGIVAGGSGYPSFDYFTPIQYTKTLLDVPPAEFITDVASDDADASPGPLVDKSFRVDETKDDHDSTATSKHYNFDFKAENGTKVVTARLVEESAAAVYDKVLNINNDRTNVNFRFRLESGPFYDRWRGWWHGQVLLTLQAQSAATKRKGDSDCE